MKKAIRRSVKFLSFVFVCLISSTAIADKSYDDILQKSVDKNGPGMAVIVYQNGKTVYAGAVGMANIEHDIPLKSDSVFRLGSITKQFTSAAIMMLQEQGKLSIDDDIHKYVPDFPTGDNKVSLAHLMTHTSGINNYTNNKETMEKLIPSPTTLDDMLKKFADEPMLFKTGERMQYSNTGYVLLGKVIEVASEQSYEAFIKENIFKKLGMKNSQYGGRQIVPSRASGYTESEHGVANSTFIDMVWPHAAGALLSTVHDLAIWNQALASGKVVSKKSYQQMIAPFKLNDGSESNYGFGLGTFPLNKYKAVGHGGGIPGFSTDSMYIPEKDLFIAVFANNDHASPEVLTLKFAAEALSIDVPEFKPAKVSEASIKKLMGNYAIDDKSVRKLSFEDGKVYSQRDKGYKWEVIPMSDNSFYYDGSLSYIVLKPNTKGQMVMNFYSRLSETPSKAIRQ